VIEKSNSSFKIKSYKTAFTFFNGSFIAKNLVNIVNIVVGTNYTFQREIIDVNNLPILFFFFFFSYSPTNSINQPLDL
jgi:hypothetical protein